MSIAKGWDEECVKKVAAIYLEIYGLTNVTYEINSDFVAFKTEGFLFTTHFRNSSNKITDECKDALCKEVLYHTMLVEGLEE